VLCQRLVLFLFRRAYYVRLRGEREARPGREEGANLTQNVDSVSLDSELDADGQQSTERSGVEQRLESTVHEERLYDDRTNEEHG
jgi:hypothetical protein